MEMSSTSSSASTRRQQQNREAQRKRRQALKTQIEELRASNLELQAFKERALGTPTSSLRTGPRPSREPDSDILSPHDSVSVSHTYNHDQDHDRLQVTLPDNAKLASTSSLNLNKDFLHDDHTTSNSNDNLIDDANHSITDFDSTNRDEIEYALAMARQRQYQPSNSETAESGKGVMGGDQAWKPWEAWEPSSNDDYFLKTTRDGDVNTAEGQVAALQLQLISSNTFNDLTHPSSDIVDKERDIVKKNLPHTHTHTHIHTRSRTNSWLPSLSSGSDSTSTSSLSSPGKSQRAMKVAVANRQTAVVKLLINHGVDVNVHDKSRRTVLHDAAEANDAKIVQLLLQNGADSNAVDGLGRSALELAAARGNIEAVEVLLKDGAH